MSKFEQLIASYKETLSNKLKKEVVDEELLRAIAKSCGPVIYKADAAKVACSDKKELDKIKSSFLVKKLKMKEGPHLDQALKDICEEMGSSNRNKYRVVFYYLLVEKFKKQDLFKSTKTTEGQPKAITKKSVSKKTFKMYTKLPEDLIHDHSLYAAGIGFIPIPIVDLAGVSIVQYQLIKKLSQQYSHVSFNESKAKSLLAAITGGFTAFELGLVARLLFKGIPFFGPIVGGTAMSGFAYISTKLIGQIFNDHFSSGGDLSIEELTIEKMRNLFKFEMKKGKASS